MNAAQPFINDLGQKLIEEYLDQNKNDVKNDSNKISITEALLSPNPLRNLSKVKHDSHAHESSEYCPKKIPPDIKIAQRHGLAMRLGKEDLIEYKTDLCICCDNPIVEDKDLLPFCNPELSHCGQGMSLFFEFYLYCIFLLFLVSTSIGVYSMYTNWNTNDCLNLEENITSAMCDRNFISKISIGNSHLHPDTYYRQSWINLIGTVLIVGSLIYLRYHQLLTEYECNRALNSPSDYTIMIRDLPKGQYTEEDIRKMLDEFWKEQTTESINQRIQKVFFAFRIGEYINLLREKEVQELQRKKIKYSNETNKNPKNEEKELIKINEKITELESKIMNIEQEVAKADCKNTCGVVLVSFDSQSLVSEILERLKKGWLWKIRMQLRLFFCFSAGRNALVFKNHVLRVERAPEPDDLAWENLDYSSLYKILMRGFSILATILVILLCFVLIFSISYGQEIIQVRFKGQKGLYMFTFIKLIGFFASLIILVINTFLFRAMQIFGKYEKHWTSTHYERSVARKLSLAQFINTGLIVLMANLIIHGKNGVYGEGTLVSDSFWIFLSSAFLVPFLSYFNIWHYLQIRKQRNLERDPNYLVLTQEEANKVFEGPVFDLSLKYASLIKTMWLTAFYTPIMPLGNILSLSGLICSYWVDKYLVLRRCSKPYRRSADLNTEMIELIEFFPMALSLGNLFFHYVLHKPSIEMMIPDLIAIALSSINCLLPMRKIIKKFVKDKDRLDYNYFEAKKKFTTDYDKANPIGIKQNNDEMEQNENKDQIAITNLKKYVQNLFSVNKKLRNKNLPNRNTNIKEVQEVNLAPNIVQSQPALSQRSMMKNFEIGGGSKGGRVSTNTSVIKNDTSNSEDSRKY